MTPTLTSFAAPEGALPSTDGFAQPSGYAGAEPCSAKPLLRPSGRPFGRLA